MNKYTRQNESLYIKPKRQKNDEKNGCIFLSDPDCFGRKRWITKEERLEEIKKEKYWRRLELGREILRRDNDLIDTLKIWIFSVQQSVNVYEKDVQQRWDKRRNDRLVRNLISATEHVTLENKRRM